MTTTFFLALAGAVSALLIRAEEHLLVTRLLRGLRLVATLATLLPFVAVGSLVFFAGSTALRTWWSVLVVLASLAFGVLLVGYRLPRVRRKPPPFL